MLGLETARDGAGVCPFVVRGVGGEADGERGHPADVQLAHARHDHARVDAAAQEDAERHVGLEPRADGVSHRVPWKQGVLRLAKTIF